VHNSSVLSPSISVELPLDFSLIMAPLFVTRPMSGYIAHTHKFHCFKLLRISNSCQHP
jgi:hypothetical protein